MSTQDEKYTQYQKEQLRRLEILMDVIFGVAIVRVFMLLPQPDPEEYANLRSLVPFFVEGIGAFAVVLVATSYLIFYWMENNRVFVTLERTDTKHTILSISQVWAMLLFLYTVKLGVEYDGDLSAMIAESTAATLMGVMSIFSWRYASKNRRLITDHVTDADVRYLSTRFLPKPFVGASTIPFAFLGIEIWTLSWVLFGWVVPRVAKRVAQAEYS